MSSAEVARHYRWSEVHADRPMNLITRRRVIAERMMVSQVSLEQGFYVPTHAHENEQIAVVMAGEVRFGVGAESSAERYFLDVRAGEVLVLPSNLPHSAEALSDAIVLDLFSPPSETTGVDVHSAGRTR